MKIRIEIDPSCEENEVILRCQNIDDSIIKCQNLLLGADNENKKIVFYKDDTEYYLSIDEILFFETSGNVIWAHTRNDDFKVKYKLYELEEMLPRTFIRISKSTILNSSKVYSITRNLTGASKIEFEKTDKTVYVSRSYFKTLKEKISLTMGS